MSATIIEADVVKYLYGRQWLFENGFLPKYHAVLSDPPYGLEFMSAEWDKPKPSGLMDRRNRDYASCRGDKLKVNKYVAGNDFQAWVTEWARLLLSAVYPGAVGLFFGGTRTYHRLATGLEDAGWEVVDCLMFLHGQGFPKSLSVSKAIDREAGADREVVGTSNSKGIRPGTGNYVGDDYVTRGQPITAPATDAARQWDGYGTATKPAYEPCILAQKPFTVVSFSAILRDINELLGGMLCLLLSNVNDAENLLKFAPVELNGVSVFVATLVSLLHAKQSGALEEKMDTFNSPEMVLTCWNIASLWNSILGELLTSGNTYTTSTEIKLITALKICKSLLLTNTPESIVQSLTLQNGLLSRVCNVENSSAGDAGNTNDTPKPFVAALATLKTASTSIFAEDVASRLQAIVPSIFSVLRDVITITETETGNTTPSPIGKLTPEYLPCVIARTPRTGYTFAQLAQTFGTGALAIDASRISNDGQPQKAWASPRGGIWSTDTNAKAELIDNPQGRYPANVILGCGCEGDHEDTCAVRLLDEQSGELTSGAITKGQPQGTNFSQTHSRIAQYDIEANTGGASRFFYTAKSANWERSAGLDGRNSHPTVKSLDLCRYLASLICPPPLAEPRRLLIPFCGSGSEMIGARLAGWDEVTGIEREHEYAAIARARLAWWAQFASIEAGKAAYDREHEQAETARKLDEDYGLRQLGLFDDAA